MITTENYIIEAETIKLKKKFGKNVRKYRKNLNMSQEQLAEKMDISVVFLSHVENGIHGIEFMKIAKLCNILKIEAKDLFS